MLTLKPQGRCPHEQEGLAAEAGGLSHTQGTPEGPPPLDEHQPLEPAL